MSNGSAGLRQAPNAVINRGRPSGWLRFSDGSRPGFKGALRETGARALTTFYRRVVFMSYPLDTAEIPVYHANIDVAFRQLGVREIDDYLRFRPECARGPIEQRIADGHRCFTSWHEGRIIDACWSATGLVHVPYLDRYLDIPAGDVFSFDSFTVRAHRGHGVYMARNSFQARHDQANGLKRSIALVARENHAALLILSRSGLRTSGTYHYLRSPGKGWYWSTSLEGESLPRLTSTQAAGRLKEASMQAAGDK